ncbi:MAG TPA: hypothetical protein VKY92_00240 [Verrucomicrobiae bacterium]|nr:hypothetical protein [Verrucomicrobiae bacterium]
MVLTVGVATWVLVATRADPEPSYEGKPLHYWVNCFSVPKNPKSTGREAKATEAIRHMGTNAFPTLLQWLCADSTEVRNYLWRRLPLSLRNIKPLGDLVFYSPKMRRAEAASRALVSLRADASPALPSVAELFITTTNFVVRTRCWVILREVGAPSVPVLTAAAGDKRCYTNNSLFEILMVLEQIRPPATSAVPALTILLQNAEPAKRTWFSNTISHITGQPRTAARP